MCPAVRVYEHHRDTLTIRELAERVRQPWLDVGETVLVDARKVETPIRPPLTPYRRLRDPVQVPDRVRHAVEVGRVLPRERDRVVPRLQPELPAKPSHEDLPQTLSRELGNAGRPHIEVMRFARDHIQ